MIKDLITTSDINKIRARNIHSFTRDEINLYNESMKLEWNIQIACCNIVEGLYRVRNDVKCIFQQNDNGGKNTKAGRMIKKAMGTRAGWPDVTIWVWKKKGDSWESKPFFVEFKRIGSQPPTQKQKEWNNFLKEMGEKVYFCNNTVYFEKVICKDIEDFTNQ